jgi:Domain of unknown function (DUF5658)
MGTIAKGRSISANRMFVWITLLALAQVADLVTTQAAMARGGVEANAVAAVLLTLGGIPLLWAVKSALVAAMATAVWLVLHYWSNTRDVRWAFAGSVVWRGLQLCVMVLALTALHNLTVLGQLNS